MRASPRSPSIRAPPDYELVRELVATLEGSGVPVILSGGLRSAERARRAYEESGADAVMIARGALGNPWIFAELTGRPSRPGPRHVVAELEWVLDRALEHWGADRAARNLRKFYTWDLGRLGITGPRADRFQRTERLEDVRELLASLPERASRLRRSWPTKPVPATLGTSL